MKPILYPYPTLDETDPILTVTGLSIDGKPKSEWIRNDESTVALFEHLGRWQKVELDLEVACLPEVVTAFEQEHGPVATVAVAMCLPTNGREQLRLSRSPTDAGRWSGKLEIDRDNYRGRVSLKATFTAKLQDVPCRPIAATNEWVVHVDEPESLQLRGNLPVKWVNFNLPIAPAIARDFPKSTHVVDFHQKLPTLYLNSSLEGLEDLLKDRKDRKGADRALHDISRTGIARSVWLALLHDAIADIREPDDETGEPADWPATPWRVEVLKQILAGVAPDKSDSEQLAMLAVDWREPNAAGNFFARAEAVIGDMLKANEVVRRFNQQNRAEALE